MSQRPRDRKKKNAGLATRPGGFGGGRGINYNICGVEGLLAPIVLVTLASV